jgi:hypothetical protein
MGRSRETGKRRRHVVGSGFERGRVAPQWASNAVVDAATRPASAAAMGRGHKAPWPRFCFSFFVICVYAILFFVMEFFIFARSICFDFCLVGRRWRVSRASRVGRVGTTRLSDVRVVHGPGSRHGVLARHGTTNLSCRSVSCQVVSCLGVFVPRHVVRPSWSSIIYNNRIGETHYTSWIDFCQHARGPRHHPLDLLSTCKLSTSPSTRILNLCLLPIFFG